MAYLYLALAILAEVIATSLLKTTEEFTKLIPSLIVISAYLISFYFLTLTLRTLPVGITYAIWAGLGIVLVAIIAAIMFKEVPDFASIVGMGLIIAGVVVINLFSKNIGH